MEITVNTKLHPLLGKPLGHSVSSAMGNKMYQHMGVDCYRLPMECDREDLPVVLDALKRLNVATMGVTKPYKVDVIPCLDEIDELSAKIGAVNSIRVVNKRLIGRNVDGPAFLDALIAVTGCQVEKTVFFIFGAGGAGRAITCTLAYHGAKKIYITDKYEPAARELTDKINQDFAPVAEMIPYEEKDAVRKAFRESGVVMNASGVGMAPDLAATPAEASWFLPSQIAFDATYNPEKTQFLKDAEAAGCRYFNGKQMLIRCSMIAFTERFGSTEPYEVWEKFFDEALAEAEAKKKGR